MLLGWCFFNMLCPNVVEILSFNIWYVFFHNLKPHIFNDLQISEFCFYLHFTPCPNLLDTQL